MSEKKKPAKPVKPPRIHDAVFHADGRCRCPWPGEDPLYVAYHDEEWGVPEWDDRALFEKLILDGFQAGLSWITILRKRDAFRAAFDGFKPEKIVRYDEAKIEALMQNPGIVRNRAKIKATIALARITLDLRKQGGLARNISGASSTASRSRTNANRCATSSPQTEVSAGDRQGPARARRQFRRADHRLRLHAGDRHGQRSSRRLPSPCRMRGAGAEVPCLKPRARGSACCRGGGSI